MCVYQLNVPFSKMASSNSPRGAGRASWSARDMKLCVKFCVCVRQCVCVNVCVNVCVLVVRV